MTKGCSRHNLTKAVAVWAATVSNFTGYDSMWGPLRAPDSHHNLYPSTLDVPARMNATVFRKMIEDVLPDLTEFKIWRDEDFPIIVDEKKCSVFFRTLAEGVFDGGRPYTQEYFLLQEWTRDGKLIQESWEMLDPNAI
ncbi:uncharacterized protein J7T54_005633 [Emericellopsis cladophorae]|uniref:SnoaL-like domain-containing protein n=1 Tax=Emericellopsis cladophorae TaxID=2686198 RepID=A0A9Q0BGQ6_9HYPO|nr:uncharacterized protein J7T54_005633 [Emericellopsis cladophorae]KAI6783604.1 hypothetical protein J7T54_005633 [Emericellopsis cladophorae]